MNVIVSGAEGRGKKSNRTCKEINVTDTTVAHVLFATPRSNL